MKDADQSEDEYEQLDEISDEKNMETSKNIIYKVVCTSFLPPKCGQAFISEQLVY